MPIVLGRLLLALLPFLRAIGLVALFEAALPLTRGLLGGFAEQKGFRGWFLRAIGVTALTNAIAWVVHRVRQAVANAALANLDAVTLYLRDASILAHHTYKELGEIMPSWANSFGIFRTHTLPQAIKTHTLPAVAGAARAGRIADRSISLGNATRIRLGRSIDKLRKELGLLAGILLGIDILVKGSHAHRHHTDHTRVLPKAASDAAHADTLAGRLADELADAKARLKRLERAIGLGVIAGLVYKVLARVAPWLFCRNVKKLGNVACGLNPTTMSALEALLLGTLGIASLEELARFAVAIEEEVASEVKSLLSA